MCRYPASRLESSSNVNAGDGSRTVGGAVHRGVVEADQDAITGDPQIRLQVAITQPDSPGERLHRVLWPEEAAAPMGDRNGRAPEVKAHGVAK